MAVKFGVIFITDYTIDDHKANVVSTNERERQTIQFKAILAALNR
ncbi:hypothetical protein [Helicobacter pylori]|nr:hypothetical protein [Helicobacter pylori]